MSGIVSARLVEIRVNCVMFWRNLASDRNIGYERRCRYDKLAAGHEHALIEYADEIIAANSKNHLHCC